MTDQLTIHLYEQFSTTAVPDPANDLQNATVQWYETQYPGGLFGSALLSIPRDVTRSFQFRGGNRLVLKSGLDVVYEGELLNPVFNIDEVTQGVEIEAAGLYGTLLNRRTLDKRWADANIDARTWIEDETATAFSKATLDRNNRLRITPKSEAWTSGQIFSIDYTMPTNQVIEKITYDYDMQEAGQAWEIDFYNATDGATSITTSSGTGSSQTYTPATPSQTVSFRYIARANQTPTANGTYYGEISNVTVYSVTSSVNLYEVALDIRAANTDLNSDESNIDSGASLSIVPFITNGPETHARILSRAAAFGDSSQNSYATYVRESDFAGTPDGKPVLVLEQYPALSSFDYAIRLDDKNLIAPFSVIWDFGSIVNYVVVQYRDANGRIQYVTPDDDATLKDTTSIADYGQRERSYPLNAGETSQTNAIAYGTRYLAYYKDPRFSVSGPITVKGYIRGNSGQRIPAAKIKAGQRLKIENFLDDLAATTGAGLTFLVTRTRHMPETEETQIYTGLEPDSLPILLAQMKAGING